MSEEKRVKKKIKHLIKLGFKREELTEIEKMHRGEFFNPNDQGYKKLLDLSAKLCHDFSTAVGKMGKNPSIFKIIKTYFYKNSILNKLFPVHKTLSGVGENLSVVIGLVDFLGCGFTNRAVTFSPYSLVECENYTIFATKIVVGDERPQTNEKGEIRLNRNRFGKDCWICGGVKIAGGVCIGSRAVVGAGAVVTSDIPDDTLAVGRVAKPVKKIDKNYQSKKGSALEVDDGFVDEVKAHIRALGKRAGKEYIKMLRGEYFNSTNLTLGGLYIYTHRLCSEYNDENTTAERKSEILSILFANHGKNLKVGKDLFVDILGSTKIGDNVTIGDGVYMSGPVTIGNGVTVGDDTLMFSTGHSVKASERRVGFNLKYGLYEFSQSSPIIINDNVTVGKSVVISPDSKVDCDIPDGSLFVKSKIV
ncbi:MAG: hypothetical protein IJY70_03170 [Clostridia bacterium]|nr:hypothetical protein [Clostridia bacterium]